ncbi:putative ubiquitin-like-specific protease 2A isoform X2 [Silene latifolia]|uniref:putative ubiquitin-like-specific protease 2A isoform X2 n=1 Tax=Silene latifolia TaxID=37657 RepID=UPI003D772CB8
MGRKPAAGSSSADLNSTICDIFGDYVSKHRSCWLHIVANHYRCKKNITWEEIERIKKRYRHTAPCFYRTLPHGVRHMREHSPNESSNWMDNHAIITGGEGNRMDTQKFQCYIKSLWKNLSEEKRAAFVHLDSLWFTLYLDPSTRPTVLTLIKQKCIFSKKGHWRLLILVHFGETLDSESRAPCMLLLDSLQNKDTKRLELEIRKFIVDIFKSEGRTEDKKAISQIPFLVPKVPQGRDSEESGSYVLYFINLFMKSAPNNFSITKGYPYFMVQNWFGPDKLVLFLKKLEKKLARKPEMTYTGTSRYKPRGKDEV